jgi:hypothetical protein
MRFHSLCFVIIVAAVSGAKRDAVSSDAVYTFPDDFKLGAATASYQIEGAWNEDGKTEFHITGRSRIRDHNEMIFFFNLWMEVSGHINKKEDKL